MSGAMSMSASDLHKYKILCNGQNMLDSEKTYSRAAEG